MRSLWAYTLWSIISLSACRSSAQVAASIPREGSEPEYQTQVKLYGDALAKRNGSAACLPISESRVLGGDFRLVIFFCDEQYLSIAAFRKVRMRAEEAFRDPPYNEKWVGAELLMPEVAQQIDI